MITFVLVAVQLYALVCIGAYRAAFPKTAEEG